MAMKDAVPDVIRPHAKAAYHWTRRHPFITGAAKAQLARDVHGEDRRLLERVSPAISINDSMAGGGWRHYFAVGLDAVRCIDAALTASSVDRPLRVLDMPCGWGRVMRFLAVRFSAAELFGCDIVDDGIGFCSERFGARPIRSSPSLDDLPLPSKLDLIWCGSLITHLDAASIDSLLRLFARSLSPHGVAVVTAHGASVARKLERSDPFYEMDSEKAAVIVHGYEAGGFGYAEYAPDADHETTTAGYPEASYGVSLTSRSWMRDAAARADLRESYFGEQVWDGHHDVYGFMLNAG